MLALRGKSSRGVRVSANNDFTGPEIPPQLCVQARCFRLVCHGANSQFVLFDGLSSGLAVHRVGLNFTLCRFWQIPAPVRAKQTHPLPRGPVIKCYARGASRDFYCGCTVARFFEKRVGVYGTIVQEFSGSKVLSVCREYFVCSIHAFQLRGVNESVSAPR